MGMGNDSDGEKENVLCINVNVHEMKWPVDVLPGGGSQDDEKYKRSDNEGIHTHEWNIWKLSREFNPDKTLL